MLTKITHSLFTALLAYTAWLQFNDPDPVFWVSLYGLAAAVPLAALIGIRPAIRHNVAAVATGFCIAGLAISEAGLREYIVYHLGSESLVQDMSPSKPYIEQGREFIGTAFALVVVIGYWLAGRQPSQVLTD